MAATQDRVERRHLAGVLLLLVVGIGANGLLLCLVGRNTGHPTRSELPTAINLSIQGAVQTMAALRSEADVVVHRDSAGLLHVSGRRVQREVTVSSLADLEVLLKGVPSPGSAFVTVAIPPGKAGVGGLVEPRPPETEKAQRDLTAALERAGFHQARGSVNVRGLWDRSVPASTVERLP